MDNSHKGKSERLLKLRNFFYGCDTCGYDLRFDFPEQTRICSRCGQVTTLPKALKKYLSKQGSQAEK